MEKILLTFYKIGHFPLFWHCYSLQNSGAKNVGNKMLWQIQNFSVCLGNAPAKNCQRLSRSDSMSCSQWLHHTWAFCLELWFGFLTVGATYSTRILYCLLITHLNRRSRRQYFSLVLFSLGVLVKIGEHIIQW